MMETKPNAGNQSGIEGIRPARRPVLINVAPTPAINAADRSFAAIKYVSDTHPCIRKSQAADQYWKTHSETVEGSHAHYTRGILNHPRGRRQGVRPVNPCIK